VGAAVRAPGIGRKLTPAPCPVGRAGGIGGGAGDTLAQAGTSRAPKAVPAIRSRRVIP